MKSRSDFDSLLLPPSIFYIKTHSLIEFGNLCTMIVSVVLNTNEARSAIRTHLIQNEKGRLFYARLFNHELFNNELFNPRLFYHEFLNHGVEKFMVEKSLLEKYGVEMSFKLLER